MSKPFHPFEPLDLDAHRAEDVMDAKLRIAREVVGQLLLGPSIGPRGRPLPISRRVTAVVRSVLLPFILTL